MAGDGGASREVFNRRIRRRDVPLLAGIFCSRLRAIAVMVSVDSNHRLDNRRHGGRANNVYRLRSAV